ncbi:MAG: protein kinase, partial [Planctomycetota bacterium]|nr:protein kinase [Planctomycetota bacterium]
MTGLADSQRDLANAARDAATLAKLHNINLSPVLDGGSVAGIVFQVLAPGSSETLADKITGWPFEPRQAAEIALAVCIGLRGPHDKGVAHCEIHPGNIEWGTDSTVTLCRFALAPVPVPENDPSRLPAVAYWAPERLVANTAHSDLSLDVYAIGVLLYQLLTGRVPFVGGSYAELGRQILKHEPLRPTQLNAQIPKPLERIVLNCLARDPHQRYESAQLLGDDLKRFLNGELIHMRGPGLVRRVYKAILRRPIQFLTPVVLLIASLVWGSDGWRRWEELDPKYQELAHKKLVADMRAKINEETLGEALTTQYHLLEFLSDEDFAHYSELEPLRKRVLSDVAEFNSTLQNRVGE